MAITSRNMCILFVVVGIGFGLQAADNPEAKSSFENWEQILESTEVALDNAGYLVLKEKYPTLFADIDHSQVTSARYSERIFEFRGPHSCPYGDPRLRFRSFSYGYCLPEEPIHGNVAEDTCKIKLELLYLSPDDPCA